MKALTPAERRGAWAVLLLLILGSAHDFIRGCEGSGSRPAGIAEVEAPFVDPTPEASPAAAAGSTLARVDLNRADSLALDALPGIGPVLTSRILAHRRAHGPFRTPEELLGVRGVGPALYGKLKDRITVGAVAKAGRDSGSGPR